MQRNQQNLKQKEYIYNINKTKHFNIESQHENYKKESAAIC